MNLQTLIFIGRSGCGKGTQVDKIIEYIKSSDDAKREIFHLEAGERFRSFIKEGTYAADLANEINEIGGLQPEFLSIWAWGGEIVRKLKPNQHLLIDGTPRRLREAQILDTALDFFDRPKTQIIYLNVSRDWSIERLQQRGRKDDVEMSDILARMDWFDNDVVPVLDFYRAHRSHNFLDINGEQSIEKVHQDILAALEI